MSKTCVIFGTGSLAELVHFFLTHDSDYDVVGFTVSGDIRTKEFLGLPVVSFDSVESKFSPEDHEMFIAIGYSRRNTVRAKFYHEAKGKGYRLLSYVSSKATTWPGLAIGENCFIFENNNIQPFVTIGNNVIMWSGNHIGHHSTIEDHCFFTSHVVLSGHCRVGEYSFFGVNATVRDDITIARDTIIGAGALILKNTQDGQVYPGTRTRPMPEKDAAKVQL